MRRSLAVLSFIGLISLAGIGLAEPSPGIDGLRGSTTQPTTHQARNLLRHLPLAFELNRGQAPEGWDFLVRCHGYHAFVNSTGIVFSFDGCGLAMGLEGAARAEPTTRGRELGGHANYFLGNDSARWISDVPLFRGAAYESVLPRTSWSVAGDGRSLEFAFDLQPGAAEPCLHFEGAREVRLARNGSLIVSMPHGQADISAPVAWQDADHGRVAVEARFVVQGFSVRIIATPRDASRPVHVDPTVSYSSYLGGSSDEDTGGAALDAAGSAYVSGSTKSAAFPTTSGAYDTEKATDGTPTVRTDGFVTKLSPDGSSLVYSTFLGGTGDETFRGMAVDSSGSAYVTGETYAPNYPTTSGVYQSSAPSGSLGVLTKLSSSGASLVFSTYVQYRAWALALGSSGSVFVLEGDGLSRYTASGSSQAFFRRIVPSTTIGGQGMTLWAVASDANGDAYVTGYTSMQNYPLTTGAYQTSLAGQYDGFVTKISSSGAIVYATLVGGSGTEYGNAIDVNWSGQAFIAGNTTSTNYPVTSGAYRTVRATGSDGFLTRLNATGTALKYSTYLGGAGTYAEAVRVHPCGSCVICGLTYDSNFPTSNAFQGSFGGGTGYDGFVMKFSPGNSLAWASFVGGSADDVPIRMGMGPDGTVAVLGQTLSSDFPTASAYQSVSYVGTGFDDFVLKIPDSMPTTLTDPTLAPTIPDWTVDRPYSRTIVPLAGLGPYSFTVTLGTVPTGLSLASSGLLSGTPTAVGTTSFDVHVDDVCEKTSDGTLTMHVNAQPAISSAVMQGWTIDVPVDQAVPTSGGTAPMTYTLLDGSVPTGTVLTPGGRIHGTPTALGDYGFTVRVVDAAGASASRSITFRVNAPPSVDAISPPPCTVGRPYTFQFSASAGTAPFTWSVAAGAAPATLDPESGALTGAAKPSGSYEFTIRAVDAAGVASERSFVAVVNPTPQIATASLPAAAVGRPYAALLAASGGTPPMSWSVQIGTLAPGIVLDPDSGALSGVVTGSGSGGINFRCTDACGAVALRGFSFDTADAVDLTKTRSGETVLLGAGGLGRVDRYLELTAGCLLGITLKGGSKDGVLPQLFLRDASGIEIDLSAWTKATSKQIRVKGFVVPETGRYFLTAIPAPGFAGKAKLSETIVPQRTWSSGGDLASEPSEFGFSAPPGAKVSISVKADRGSGALPRIVSIFDEAGLDLVPGGSMLEKGGTAHFMSKIPLAGGDYRVLFSTRDATAGPVTWSVRLKPPKTYSFALPDLAAGD